MGDCAARLPQTEVDTPGYGKFFLYVLRNSIDVILFQLTCIPVTETQRQPYYDSLARVAPVCFFV